MVWLAVGWCGQQYLQYIQRRSSGYLHNNEVLTVIDAYPAPVKCNLPSSRVLILLDSSALVHSRPYAQGYLSSLNASERKISIIFLLGDTETFLNSTSDNNRTAGQAHRHEMHAVACILVQQYKPPVVDTILGCRRLSKVSALRYLVLNPSDSTDANSAVVLSDLMSS